MVLSPSYCRLLQCRNDIQMEVIRFLPHFLSNWNWKRKCTFRCVNCEMLTTTKSPSTYRKMSCNRAGTDMNEAETGNRKSWCHFNICCNHIWGLDVLEMSPWIYETAKIFHLDSVTYLGACSLKIELYEAIMF